MNLFCSNGCKPALMFILDNYVVKIHFCQNIRFSQTKMNGRKKENKKERRKEKKKERKKERKPCVTISTFKFLIFPLTLEVGGKIKEKDHLQILELHLKSAVELGSEWVSHLDFDSKRT